MARVLVTEEIAEAGLELLSSGGHAVDVQLGLSDGDLTAALKGASALVVRSATQVTSEVLEATEGLIVVGRAGIGLDNVDVRTATRRGVMVVNAPLSNSVSAAEHTMALLLAQARCIPQAHTDLVGGAWDRSRWQGVVSQANLSGPSRTRKSRWQTKVVRSFFVCSSLAFLSTEVPFLK